MWPTSLQKSISCPQECSIQFKSLLPKCKGLKRHWGGAHWRVCVCVCGPRPWTSWRLGQIKSMEKELSFLVAWVGHCVSWDYLSRGFQSSQQTGSPSGAADAQHFAWLLPAHSLWKGVTRSPLLLSAPPGLGKEQPWSPGSRDGLLPRAGVDREAGVQLSGYRSSAQQFWFLYLSPDFLGRICVYVEIYFF